MPIIIGWMEFTLSRSLFPHELATRPNRRSSSTWTIARDSSTPQFDKVPAKSTCEVPNGSPQMECAGMLVEYPLVNDFSRIMRLWNRSPTKLTRFANWTAFVRSLMSTKSKMTNLPELPGCPQIPSESQKKLCTSLWFEIKQSLSSGNSGKTSSILSLSKRPTNLSSILRLFCCLIFSKTSQLRIIEVRVSLREARSHPRRNPEQFWIAIDFCWLVSWSLLRSFSKGVDREDCQR